MQYRLIRKPLNLKSRKLVVGPSMLDDLKVVAHVPINRVSEKFLAILEHADSVRRHGGAYMSRTVSLSVF